MSARRFKTEKDYFGKRSRLPEELIGSKEISFMVDSQNATVISENNYDEKIEDLDKKSLRSDLHKYLAFRLRGQGYALETSKVKEIVRQMRITPVPRAPEYVKGVAKLRDRVIPVVDIGHKLGMKETDLTEQSCIIVVEVTGSMGSVSVGILVDTVSEVIEIHADQIQKSPAFGVRSDTAYISGIAMLEDDLNIMLNIDRVLD